MRKVSDPVLDGLLDANTAWARAELDADADVFVRSSQGQRPDAIWIGCADSRVPGPVVVGAGPGRLFEHRNIANVIRDDDPNSQALLQFALDHLKVPRIIVCGHTRCAGVRAAMDDNATGGVRRWVEPIHQSYVTHQARWQDLSDDERFASMCRQNVIDQVRALCAHDAVVGAWRREQRLSIHGWLFALETGRVDIVVPSVEGPSQIPSATPAKP